MKKLAVLLALIILVSSLSACVMNKPQPSKPESSSVPSSSEVDSSTPESSESSSSEESSSASTVTPPAPEEPVPEEFHSAHTSHYCYSKLSDRQKEYYDKMYDAIYEMNSGWITLGDADATYKTDIAVARTALSADHPQIFWLPSYYACATTNEGKTAVICFSYSPTNDQSYLILRSEKAAMTAALDAAIREITSQVTATDPYGIELQLHDLLVNRITYATNTSDPMVYNAYGALVKKSAVCEGYSRAMQLLLERFGITSVLVTGVAAGEGHMWNAVKLDGEWYHLDVTWDDMRTDMISHEYFNLSDAKISENHQINKNHTAFTAGELDNSGYSFNIKTPVCSGYKNYYFTKSGFVFAEDGEEALVDYIASSDKSIIEVAFSSTALRNLFDAEDQERVANINMLLALKYPEHTLQIGGYSISATVLRLYMQPITVEEN